MSLEEALAWLRGERSTINWLEEPICSQSDAAMTQQAYWTVRAHKEGLLAEHTEEQT
jgi:hypothetical protein